MTQEFDPPCYHRWKPMVRIHIDTLRRTPGSDTTREPFEQCQICGAERPSAPTPSYGFTPRDVDRIIETTYRVKGIR